MAPRPVAIDSAAPMRSLLDASGVSIAELARRLDRAPATVSNAITTGDRVQLSTLLAAAEAAGGTLRLVWEKTG